ncbi:FKBP-type peptidyl-prolyl cis-trans isomerase [Sphingomonas cannabina]|uniref:FKBP-type peptidyl-prolyl cis-trans isomerase n=1 Tax=Sphingomonas cannabina TaxID=2899123 RepID=UPI001F30450D|nr:FKBP-type peptidyl-prolyl cis-trans isomerase [Sphingomonas cannabina]UIJ44444.1 FKBP-type peptidyl-prolyl cis-trans isomerase [Sphingomonas cannabina]
MSTVTAVPIPPTKRRVIVYLVLGILLAVAAAAALAWQMPTDPALAFLGKNARQPGVVTTASGLQYKVLEKGQDGPSPTDTDVALVNYEGKLVDGTTFDKSQQPTPMPVAGVVPGFSEALKLMHKGAKYRFWIKPSLGYGAKGAGPIPPNSMLVFDVELLDFLPEAVIRQMQMQQQMQNGGEPNVPGGPNGVLGAQPGR